MAKLHFISDMSNQIVLVPQRLDERIAENDPVRLINSLIDNIAFFAIAFNLKKMAATMCHDVA